MDSDTSAPPSWWHRQSVGFRRMVFLSVAWAVAVPLVIWLFQRGWWVELQRPSDPDRIRVVAIMAIPAILTALRAVYVKTVLR